MILIYTEHITPRLQYMLHLGSTLLGGCQLNVTNDRDAYLKSPRARINYSPNAIASGEFHIIPAGLLAETGIRPLTLSCFDCPEGYKAFFSGQGPMGFDIFSAAFFLLSRYEEYGPHQKDIYGRYAHENALAWREGFLDKPLVNTWFEDLRQKLNRHFPALGLVPPVFRFLPTYDIDMAWSFREKGLWRNAGGLLKQLAKAKWKEAGQRIAVLLGQRKDPFDTFDLLDEWHSSFDLRPVYFFLLAEKTSVYDKNISPYNFAYRRLIKQLAETYTPGIHPSWQSGDDTSLVKKETDLLRQISGLPVSHSRQHYIRMALPETYRLLINIGITDDYSMGYGGINGFRASAAFPYYWYDLEKEETTSLLLHPFCFMDANSFYEQKQSPAASATELQYYFDTVKKVNGEFSMIWHHPFFGTEPAFAGWRDVYEQFLQKNFTP